MMSDNDVESVEASSGYDNDVSWISWYCSLSGNQLFCQIDRAFISDSFNLFGLKNNVGKDFNRAVETILSKQGPSDSDSESERLTPATSMLYGLIHARYIITSMGLDAMRKKYLEKHFGECPRAYCRGQAVLPVGFSDEPRHSSVKIFCPQCGEAYHASSNYRHIDGAYFSTTFPHLFFMTYEDLVPGMQLPTGLEKYAPRIFGFKVYSGKDKEIKDNASTKDSSKESSVGKGKTKGPEAIAGPSNRQSIASAPTNTASLIKYAKSSEDSGKHDNNSQDRLVAQESAPQAEMSASTTIASSLVSYGNTSFHSGNSASNNSHQQQTVRFADDHTSRKTQNTDEAQQIHIVDTDVITGGTRLAKRRKI